MPAKQQRRAPHARTAPHRTAPHRFRQSQSERASERASERIIGTRRYRKAGSENRNRSLCGAMVATLALPLASQLPSQSVGLVRCDRRIRAKAWGTGEPHVEIFNIDNSYFNEWLSGFIEAEGCFSIRKTSNNHSFSIGQNKDKIILDKIKNHFNITNQVRIIDDKFWFIEVYKKSALIKIINHCIEYPLLGEKRLSFNKFRDLFK